MIHLFILSMCVMLKGISKSLNQFRLDWIFLHMNANSTISSLHLLYLYFMCNTHVPLFINSHSVQYMLVQSFKCIKFITYISIRHISVVCITISMSHDKNKAIQIHRLYICACTMSAYCLYILSSTYSYKVNPIYVFLQKVVVVVPPTIPIRIHILKF